MTDAFSASSSSAADPTTSGSCDYSRHDVFVNHRGPDTKKTFASYLYHRLLSHGFTVFLDREELQEGLPFPSQIEGAIQTASVHVAVFSLTYAESPWCLKELLLMLKSGAPIIPVFYHVEPSELRRTQNKNGRYGKALHDLQMKKTKDPQTDMTVPRYDPATIQNWRNVLSSVADISGFDLDNKFNGDEGKLLDQVVKRVVEIMATKTPLYVAKYPTGLDDKVKDIERVVKQQHTRKVEVVGIVGLGGMGKTTLALEFFNRKRAEYDTSHFLSDVREKAKSPVHLLQRELHKGLTKSDRCIDNIHQGTQMLKEFLSSPSSRFLIILDDVDHEEQVDSLLPNRDNYCSNSLILITSRDRGILRKSGVEETSIYKLTGLPRQHSRELFCSYAFCQAYPLLGFEDLVDKFLEACHGLPLSLKVFGALFLGKNDKSHWQEILSRVYEVPHDIHKILKISFDALHEKEQQIFLDIACFFLGKKRDITVRIWDEPGWKGSSRFQNLESKCLVEVDSDNYIHMHDHLRDLGREIALNKLPRRLWHPENIYNLLEQSSGLTEVRTIKMLPNNDTYSDSYNVALSLRKRSPELFENCMMSLHNIFYRFLGIGVKKLQLLDTEGDRLEFILRRVHSPNLIWLYWRDCPYSYLPSWIPMQNLRVLRVEGELLKTLWQDRSQALLEVLVLERCSELKALPDSFGNLLSLQHMELSCCEGLERLPETFGNLPSLQYMKLSECKGLQRLPETFGNLPNLQYMELSGCKGLQRLPESFGNLPSLQHMKLSQCGGLRRLPESFGNLPSLQHMNLSQCGRLRRLPESFGNLRSLQHMQLSWCGSLERLSESFGNMPSLQYMELSGCGSLERLPESFGNLPSLQHMKLSQCLSLQSLSDSFGNLRSLQHMELCGCGSLKRLPESFGNLWSLQRMKLSECGSLQRLPESFGNLSSLERMELSDCESLQSLPESFGNLSSLEHMELFFCGSLQRLPESIGNLSSLERMELFRCGSLQRLPESIGNLSSLERMELFRCGSLQRLPESFGNLSSLEHMKLSFCGSLQRLPESIGNLSSLERMELCCCGSLQRLPVSLGHLSSLQSMRLITCKSLQKLPESFGNLSTLQHMHLSGCGCGFLERLSESFGNLRSLESMVISGCGSLEPLLEIGNLLGEWSCLGVSFEVCGDCQVIEHQYRWASKKSCWASENW